MKVDFPVPEGAEVTIEAGEVTLEFALAASYPYFDGHFDGNPIVPAIAQIGWMLAAAEVLQGQPLQAYSLSRCKFKHPIRPGDRVRVCAQKRGGKFKTSVSVESEIAATGSIAMEDGHV